MTLEEIKRLLDAQLALASSSAERETALRAIAGLLEFAANAHCYLGSNSRWPPTQTAWGWKQEMAKSLFDLERLEGETPRVTTTGDTNMTNKEPTSPSSAAEDATADTGYTLNTAVKSGKLYRGLGSTSRYKYTDMGGIVCEAGIVHSESGIPLSTEWLDATYELKDRTFSLVDIERIAYVVENLTGDFDRQKLLNQLIILLCLEGDVK